MNFDLFAIFSVFTLAAFVTRVHASYSNYDQQSVPSKPQCTFPLLKERLIRMITFDVPFAFDVILHSECRGRFDSSNPDHLQVFDYLLTLSQSRDVTDYLNIIMKDESYNHLMFRTWFDHRPLLSHPVLLILKANLRHVDSSKIYSVSLEYPNGSQERLLLNSWLVELQRPMLNWPFSAEKDTSSTASPLKVKSFKGPQSWSDFENVPGSISKSIEDEEAIKESSEPEPKLIFGHIYGWISRKKRPIVCNSQNLFHLCGHVVKLHDTFLSFASPKFSLETYAKSAENSGKSFFEISNGALRQKLTQSAKDKHFAACRLKGGSRELQAILKGDLTLVVLGQRESGEYDYKYPENPYDAFINGSKDLHDISIEVAPTDIVLFLPRSLFTYKDFSISPHDIPGSFHHTELSTFAGTFVNFINYVYLKTRHHGLIAVGGFVHIQN